MNTKEGQERQKSTEESASTVVLNEDVATKGEALESTGLQSSQADNGCDGLEEEEMPCEVLSLETIIFPGDKGGDKAISAIEIPTSKSTTEEEYDNLVKEQDGDGFSEANGKSCGN